MRMVDTLGNKEWLQKNEDAIKKLFPETWTHVRNLNALQVGFGLKVLGCDWRSKDDFRGVMLFLEKARLVLRDDMCVKRNPDRVFMLE